jgi:hypothetical protein
VSVPEFPVPAEAAADGRFECLVIMERPAVSR